MRKLCLLVALAWAAAAVAQTSMPEGDRNSPSFGPSDWEKRQEERDRGELAVKLPPLPMPENLIEFYVSAGSTFRFFIDAASVAVGEDGIVRYTLVARSASGADNVSYEGMRCRSGEYKVYAYSSGAKWSPAVSEWKPVEPKSVQRWHQALRREYFCPFNAIVVSTAQAVDFLREGGHPDFRRKY